MNSRPWSPDVIYYRKAKSGASRILPIITTYKEAGIETSTSGVNWLEGPPYFAFSLFLFYYIRKNNMALTYII